jgi:regulator of RNase E activity RraA
MTNQSLQIRLAQLSTPHLADACREAKIQGRFAPSAIRPLHGSMRCAGRVRPVRHVGSVGIILEAIRLCTPGEILVVDNEGRTDEACIGDLITLEARQAGLKGVVVWGFHRDSEELLEIGLPIFSAGSLPNAPARRDARPAEALDSARIGSWTVTGSDLVAADSNGIIFIPGNAAEAVLDAAEAICAAERNQAALMRSGTSLREQLQFEGYLVKLAADPDLDFRDHVRSVRKGVTAE